MEGKYLIQILEGIRDYGKEHGRPPRYLEVNAGTHHAICVEFDLEENKAGAFQYGTYELIVDNTIPEGEIRFSS